ncbi:MAG: di-heme-cytochrome C peroxidase [Roseibium sp.]
MSKEPFVFQPASKLGRGIRPSRWAFLVLFTVLFGAVLLAVRQPALAQPQGDAPCASRLSPGSLPPAGSYEEAVRILCQNMKNEERTQFWFTPQGSQIIPYSWFLSLEQPRDPGQLISAPNVLNALRYLPQEKNEIWNPGGLPVGFTRDRFSLEETGELADGNSADNEIFKPFISKRYKDLGLPTDWLGFNCATCHSGQVEYNGARFLIEGAPAMGDFEALMGLIVDSMEATLCQRMSGAPFPQCDGQKFDRFADRLKTEHNDNTAPAKLREQLLKMTRMRWEWNQRNRGHGGVHATNGAVIGISATEVGSEADIGRTGKYGYARLDAIGAIFNEIAASSLKVEENAHFANAPVSYPFIWDTPRYDFVQWNGSVGNEGTGALGRNVGEVLGVFGALKPNFAPKAKLWEVWRLGEVIDEYKSWFGGHETSVNVDGLARLEDLLWKMKSPQWPEAYFKKRAEGAPEGKLAAFAEDAQAWTIDRDKALDGQMYYAAYCAKCHNLSGLVSENKALLAKFVPVGTLHDGYRFVPDKNGIGTDKTMALNFQKRRYLTGEAKGSPTRYVQGDALEGVATGLSLLAYGVAGTIASAKASGLNINESVNAGRPAGFDWRKQEQDKNAKRCTIGETDSKSDSEADDKDQLVCYKARSLNGIWATGPFLHNGSVRTIRQVLLCEEREEQFYVGSREFDPAELGFKSEERPEDALSGQIEAFLFDTSLPGNRNTGHDFLPNFNCKKGGTLSPWAKKVREDMALAIMEYLKTL